MPFGILDDKKLDNVPGTDLLSDRGRSFLATIDEGRDLKRGTGKNSHIILIPQPSDDPCDPLNWPRWRKEACFWTLVFTSGLTGALFSIASAGFLVLAKHFEVSVDTVASALTTYAPALAISILFQNTLAVKYGLRIVYLGSTFLIFIGCLWTALSPNLTSIRVSRIFQGFGMAPAQCLIATTLEHIYFVHERGSRSIIWNFALIGGTTLGPFIYGYVIQHLSWQLGFWFASIACGLSFVCVFCFVPETTRHRQAPQIQVLSPNKQDTSSDVNDKNIGTESPQSETSPFLSRLKVYNGTFSDESFWKIFTRSFTLIASPVGLTHLGSLVGVVLAMLLTGPLSDRTIVWMSQRNRGVYEPEFRLVLMLTMLFGVFGYVGWAVGDDNHMPWIGAVACFAMVTFGLVASSGAAVTYLLDTHGSNAQHILSLVRCANYLILYGSTFVDNAIVVSRGIKVSLLILGACQAACWLATLPMYVYGKRVRSFIARHPRLFRGAPLAGPAPESDSTQSEPTAGPEIDAKY
ncbi:MFS general substrate transporter [Ganoderma sinense ZZ0214-1]|uniref:MFS general substrate transporter n=1 Tax=Ganoderma sinense ZZ0214-1 TaxID=1077348 RepID=A0A2G8SBE7_9APHY|nr:MFS general substrate transporter [Ganoderma sinense ZZ0214-1]